MTHPIVEFLRNAQPAYHPGWGGPEYTSWQDEQMSWKTTCYVGDWSFLWDLEVSGPDALKVFRDTGVNSVENFAIGQAKHLVQCNTIGKVVAEGVVMRMAEDRFRTQSSTAFWTAFNLERGSYDARWREIKTFQLQVSGPKALAVCEKVTGESLRDIKFMHFRRVAIAGCEAYAVRQGMAGEIGFEFHGAQADKAAVLAAILTAGEEFGIRRLGRRTAMINHLEAAFPTGLWHYLANAFTPDTEGYREFIETHFDTSGIAPTLHGSFQSEDIHEYTFSPFELGWAKCVKFDHEFVGRAALERELAEDNYRRRVTLEYNSDDIVKIYASLFGQDEPYEYIDIPHPQRWGAWTDAVLQNDRPMGIASMPGYSYFFRRMLALAFVDKRVAQPGSQVQVLWGEPGKRQTLIRATVAPAPYKRDNRRSELNSVA